MVDRGAPPRILLDRMVPGGFCLGRLPDGKVVLVRGGVPGDLVEYQVESEKASLVRARAVRVVEPSPHREEAPCSFVERCGGCPLLPLTREHELAAKRSIVEQALARTGRFGPSELGTLESVRHVDSRIGYRTRMRFQHRAGTLGFFERQTNSLVVVDHCAVASAELGVLLEKVRALFGPRADAFSRVEGIELSVFPANAKDPEPAARRSAIVFYERAERTSMLSSRDLQPFSELGEVRVIHLGKLSDPPGEAGAGQRYWVLPGLYLRIPAGGFSQVHPGVNRLLIASVLESARRVFARTFYDLYGGAGNFTLPLLSSGLKGTLIEVNARAVALAERAAQEQELFGGSYRAEPVERAVQSLSSAGSQADLVVLDPPRAGAKYAVEPALRLAKSCLILIGCDPTAFARDLRELVDLGGSVRAIIPFDMFPGTHHVELLAVIDPPAAR